MAQDRGRLDWRSLGELKKILVRKSDWSIVLVVDELTIDALDRRIFGMYDDSRVWFGSEERTRGFVDGLSHLLKMQFVVERDDEHLILLVVVEFRKKRRR